MNADFTLLQPEWLAAAVVALALGGIVMRRRRMRGGPHAAVPGAQSAVLLVIVLAACIVAVWSDSSGAHLLLAGLAALLALWLAVQAYQDRPGGLGGLAAAVCTVARWIAWLALLMIVGSAAWRSRVVEWERPLLAVLLDQSTSMGIADRVDLTQAETVPTRAEITNAVLNDLQPLVRHMQHLYDIRLYAVGQTTRDVSAWRIDPQDRLTALAAAVRRTAQTRSVAGDAPAAILVVSDGAENAADPQVLLQAAGELAEQRTALIAAGVGPEPGTLPGIQIEPLDIPARVGRRDRLRVQAAARATGITGHDVRIELLWDDESYESRTQTIRTAGHNIRETFETQPPAAGLHRLTVRIALPAALGGETFRQSAMVDVRDDPVHVMIVESKPRTEVGFLMRALRGDPRFDVDVSFRAAGGNGSQSPLDWSTFDVVHVGQVRRRQLTDEELEDLADAVTQRGVGLLLAGGLDLFNRGDFVRTPITPLCPVAFTLRRPTEGETARFTPTDRGAAHPILEGLDTSVGGAGEDLWERLPPLPIAARFGETRPLAVVIATDGARRTLLAVQEVGHGRCAAAAWAGTWPWALASDLGFRTHRRFWRQLCIWLANRRPSAYVLAERPEYVRAAVASGQETIRIRAGVTGVRFGDVEPDAASSVSGASLRLRRTARPATQPATQPVATRPDRAPDAGAATVWNVPLRRTEQEWVAELPRDLATETWLQDGDFVLEFEAIQGQEAVQDDRLETGATAHTLTARSGFAIRDVDPERLRPTANLDLLRQAAERTQDVDGRYVPVQELPDVLNELASHDRRRRIEREVLYDPVRRDPWLLLGLIAGALSIEWAVRRRAGLA